MTTLTLTRPRAPRAAFGNMVFNEARLAWRQPAGMIAGTGIALLLLVIFGEIPVFRQSSAKSGRLFGVRHLHPDPHVLLDRHHRLHLSSRAAGFLP